MTPDPHEQLLMVSEHMHIVNSEMYVTAANPPCCYAMMLPSVVSKTIVGTGQAAGHAMQHALDGLMIGKGKMVGINTPLMQWSWNCIAPIQKAFQTSSETKKSNCKIVPQAEILSFEVVPHDLEQVKQTHSHVRAVHDG